MGNYGWSGEKGGTARKDNGELRAEWEEGGESPVGIVVSYVRSGRRELSARRDSGKLRSEWREGGSRL